MKDIPLGGDFDECARSIFSRSCGRGKKEKAIDSSEDLRDFAESFQEKNLAWGVYIM